MNIPKYTVAKKKAPAPAPTTRKGSRSGTSMRAREVGKEVVRMVANGGIKPLAKIIRAKGYSDAMARNPKKVTEQKSYKDVVDPVVAGLEKIRMRLITEMNRKSRKLTKVDIQKLSNSLKNTTHDIQLLTGGKTEDTGIGEYVKGLEDLRKEIMSNKKK